MKIGKGCKISDKISVYGGDKIEIGDNVRIDDFCVLSGGSGLKIGSHIHIAVGACFFAGSGIELGDFCQIAAYSLLLSESDDFSGQSLIGPQVPMKYKPGYKSGRPIVFGRHVTLGAKCTILPGVTMGEGAIVGAHSLVTANCDPWALYAGTPARWIRRRDLRMLDLEREFLAEYEARHPQVVVSVICLSYNQKEFIREAIDGILMQDTSYPFEVIVHDDASTDGTADIIREYAATHPGIVRPIFQTENQFSKTGRYPIANAYAAAQGRYIAECDGDDIWTDPHKLQKQVSFLEQNSDYSMCHHDYRILRSGQLLVPSGAKPKDFTRDEMIAFAPDGYGIGTCTKVYRNYYPSAPEDVEDFLGDYPMNVYLGTKGKCKFIEGIHPSIYRKHNKNSWAALPAGVIRERTAKMYREIYDLMVKRADQHGARLREAFLHG
jgi:acetyltransferase-like isoleucine patch superfamily enzyme